METGRYLFHFTPKILIKSILDSFFFKRSHTDVKISPIFSQYGSSYLFHSLCERSRLRHDPILLLQLNVAHEGVSPKLIFYNQSLLAAMQQTNKLANKQTKHVTNKEVKIATTRLVSVLTTAAT